MCLFIETVIGCKRGWNLSTYTKPPTTCTALTGKKCFCVYCWSERPAAAFKYRSKALEIDLVDLSPGVQEAEAVVETLLGGAAVCVEAIGLETPWPDAAIAFPGLRERSEPVFSVVSSPRLALLLLRYCGCEEVSPGLGMGLDRAESKSWSKRGLWDLVNAVDRPYSAPAAETSDTFTRSALKFPRPVPVLLGYCNWEEIHLDLAVDCVSAAFENGPRALEKGADDPCPEATDSETSVSTVDKGTVSGGELVRDAAPGLERLELGFASDVPDFSTKAVCLSSNSCSPVVLLLRHCVCEGAPVCRWMRSKLVSSKR